MKSLNLGAVAKFGLAVFCAGSLLCGAAQAVPIEVFKLDHPDPASGIPAGTDGTVTITQVSINKVSIAVVLNPNVLFVNTGGPHTAFAFNLTAAAAAALNLAANGISVTSPVGTIACSPPSSPCFVPHYGTEPVTPFRTLRSEKHTSGLQSP